MIRVTCPKCQAGNQRSDDEAGQVVTCSACEEKMRVPAAKKKEEKADLDDLELVDEPDDTEEPRRSRDEEPDDDEEERPRKKKKKKATSALGPRRASFKPNKGLLVALLIGFAVLGAAGVVCFVLGIANIMVDGGIALSVFMIPTGIIGFLWCLSVVSLKVVLHEGGLVHSKYGKRRLIAWEDILSVKQAITEHYTNGAYSGTTYLYTLELDDGTRIVYTNYRLQKVEKLGKEIMEKTSELLLPQAMRRYEKGKVVDFGKMGVSKKGLHSGSSLLKWKEITGVQLKEGYVSVRKRGKWLNWCNIAVASIPNPFVFLALVNQIVGVDE